MQDKRVLPISTAGPSGDSTIMQGGNRTPAPGCHQPPSVGSLRGHVEVPVGALVRYTGTHRRITFEDWQSDRAMVLDRRDVHYKMISGPQPNPDVWPAFVSMLLIHWLDEPGGERDDRWKPRAWLEVEEQKYITKKGWESGRGPIWVMERAGTGGGSIMWEVIE